MVRDVRFGRLHVFPFSARPSTEAAGLKPVDPAVATRNVNSRLLGHLA